MAKATGTSVHDAVQRWADASVDVDTSITQEAGLFGAEMTVTSDVARVRLIVTHVGMLNGADPATAGPGEAHAVFGHVLNAVGDARVLAAEVQRLEAQVAKLKEKG